MNDEFSDYSFIVHNSSFIIKIKGHQEFKNKHSKSIIIYEKNSKYPNNNVVCGTWKSGCPTTRRRCA